MNRIVKKIAAVLLLTSLLLVAAACSRDNDADNNAELTFENVRIAFIHVGGIEDRGYTYRQHRGTTDMMAELGISEEQVSNWFNIAPGDPVQTALQ